MMAGPRTLSDAMCTPSPHRRVLPALGPGLPFPLWPHSDQALPGAFVF